ncbi:hypothetical protein [Pyrococcus sp. ST04]|uniref:hypothetical protein n=1 Tax=Pyrococcus sp. ST04 TaxID=1183377 RepID=UPI00064EBB24|nr:hypothetical protein [Pyrococcus sp. ST04]
MGYTVYYKTKIDKWREFIKLIERISGGLGIEIKIRENEVILKGEDVEELRIKKEGYSSVKTYGREPYTSIYLLILYSISSFGSVEVWED